MEVKDVKARVEQHAADPQHPEGGTELLVASCPACGRHVVAREEGKTPCHVCGQVLNIKK